MKLATCPIVPWYQFKQCDIATCKNHTKETARCCLELDRKKPEGTKQFSDAELNFYKFKDKGISTRLVQIHRKNAVQNVKAILALKKFIEWIADNFQPGGTFNYPDFRALEKESPLRIKRLGWKNWMWEYVLDDQVWSRFVARLDGECRTFEVHQLLGLKLGRYEELLRQFQQPKHKGMTHHGKSQSPHNLAS